MKETAEHKANAAQIVSAFLIKHRIPLISVLVILLVASVGVSAYFGVTSMLYKQGFTKLDTLEFALTQENKDETVVAVKKIAQSNAHNPVGARSFLLLGDILFSQSNWQEAKIAYEAAARADSKSYTAPICYYNAAVCAEESGDLTGAIGLYTKAADSKNFALGARALYNVGRLFDTQGNYEKAVQQYDDVSAKYSADPWANLAKSRSLILRAEGKVN